ncbi:hypothetical protein C2E23DRAFT_310671 [Lenzites betulinus]|nr:hypothetical protein C2E23DRAFT_310671 [Lenzites betulinus]
MVRARREHRTDAETRSRRHFGAPSPSRSLSPTATMSNRDKFTTPVASTSRFLSSIPRSSAVKRDSLAAELERDPQLSTAKRQQRTQAFSTHMSQALLERQLAAAQAAKLELESKVREKELAIERLEGDRRWLAEREKEEREEKERERDEHIEYKVREPTIHFLHLAYTRLLSGKQTAKSGRYALRCRRCGSSTSISKKRTRPWQEPRPRLLPLRSPRSPLSPTKPLY